MLNFQSYHSGSVENDIVDFILVSQKYIVDYQKFGQEEKNNFFYPLPESIC